MYRHILLLSRGRYILLYMHAVQYLLFTSNVVYLFKSNLKVSGKVLCIFKIIKPYVYYIPIVPTYYIPTHIVLLNKLSSHTFHIRHEMQLSNKYSCDIRLIYNYHLYLLDRHVYYISITKLCIVKFSMCAYFGICEYIIYINIYTRYQF